MKKVFAFFALAVFLSGCGSSDSSSVKEKEQTQPKKNEMLEPYYNDLKGLSSNSMAIIEGKVNSSHIEYIDDTTGEIVNKDDKEDSTVFLYTVYDVTVTEAFKGTLDKGKTVQVKLFGDGKQLVSDNVTYLDVGNEYLFFANYFEANTEIPMWLSNQYQSVYQKSGSNYIPLDEKLNELRFDISDIKSITTTK